MTRTIIAIDIDDVLADNAEAFVDFSNQRYGTNLSVDDYDEHWAQVWRVDDAEVDRRATELHESGAFASYAHKEEALPVLRRLSERFDLIVVTSRRLQIREDTLQWINTHYPDIFSDENIHFAGIWDVVDDTSIHRTKADLVQRFGAAYLVDDQAKHCRAVAEAGGTALLFGNYSWNKNADLHPRILRVSSWAEVEEFFEHVR